jgi:hypothetical protein
MNNTVVVFHFQPLEIFPPVMNFLNSLEKKITDDTRIFVITTSNDPRLKNYQNENITIIRYRGINPYQNKFIKLLRYTYIYLGAFFLLITKRPKSIFYYETLSALPCVIYKKIFSKVKLFVHYHELVTQDELKTNRLLNKFTNKLEEKNYSKYSWISQTNEQRLDLFLDQYQILKNSNIHFILPNYPSKNWLNYSLNDKLVSTDKIRLVHIGALSSESMYFIEVLNFVANSEHFYLDFYSFTDDQTIISKIETSKNCSFKGGINYESIPEISHLYDVGLVLYNGSSLNFTYNAPNKIFEYLALGWDVWCSNKLLTAFQYQITNTFPKMLIVNFEELNTFKYKEEISRENLRFTPSPYNCEMIYSPLINKLTTY